MPYTANQPKEYRKTKASPAFIPMPENIEWGIDFLHDVLASGRQIRSLNMIAPFSRFCRGMFINYSIPAKRLIELLERAIKCHGKSASMRSDNGSEFSTKRFQLWLKKKEIKWMSIPIVQPQENFVEERFNRTARGRFI